MDWDRTEDDDEPDDGERTSPLGSSVAVVEMADMWLRAASQYRLLTAEEEVRAGQGQRVCRCCDSPQLALINHNLRLVVSTAKGYKAGATSFERVDIWQAGTVGLMSASHKWDASRGYKFSTYATWWIRQAISRHLSEYGYTVREPIYRHARRNQALRSGEEFEAMLIPASLDLPARQDDPESDLIIDLVPDPHAPDPQEVVAEASTRDELLAAMRAVLTPREALVLALRFGVLDEGGPTVDMKLEEIGAQLGVTRERVRQIQEKAIEKLRGALEYDPFAGLRKRRRGVYYEQSAKQNATPPTPKSQTTRRLAPDVASPATDTATREPHDVSQSRQTATKKQSRRRAPSRSSAPASAEVVVVVPASVDVLSAVGVTGPDKRVSERKRTTATPRLTRGRRTNTKQPA